jgi:hypothetical protein
MAEGAVDAVDAKGRGSDLPGAGHHKPIQEAVARILYPVSMVGLMVWLTAWTVILVWVVIVARGETVAPGWFGPLTRVLDVIGSVLAATSTELSRLFDTAIVGGVAIVMGAFLGRCSTNPTRFEVALVIAFLLFGIAQLVGLFSLPSEAVAKDAIPDGDVLTRNLIALLGRNANVALAVAFAALGISYAGKTTK